MWTSVEPAEGSSVGVVKLANTVELTQTGNLQANRLPLSSGTEHEKDVTYRCAQPESPKALGEKCPRVITVPDQPIHCNRDEVVHHTLPTRGDHLDIHLPDLEAPGSVSPFQLVLVLKLIECLHFGAGD